MIKKSMIEKESTVILTGIIVGAAAGGIFSVIIFGASINRVLLGAFIGAFLGGLGKFYTQRNKSDSRYGPYTSVADIQLKEEQLDISKKLVQTGDVRMHKEILTEDRNITVPIMREELVIEKKVINNDNSSMDNEFTETARIPVRTESVEVIKHPVILEDVEVYKRQFQEIQHIEENVKKEKLNVKTHKDGD